MERLTARDPVGNAYLPYCEECGGDMCRYRCEHFDKVCEKLAGYEEQGEQEEKLLAESEAARAELGRRLAAAQKMNAELTEAQALMVKEFTAKLEELHEAKSELEKYRKAEQDGRLVVLPCKVGDTVYMPVGKWGTITGYEADECDGFHIASDGVLQIKAKCYSGNHGTYGVPGKTVFLTREEAEAALSQKGGTHEADSV